MSPIYFLFFSKRIGVFPSEVNFSYKVNNVKSNEIYCFIKRKEPACTKA